MFTRRFLVALLAGLCVQPFAHSRAAAQTARAGVHDSTIVSERIYRRLFEGVRLSADDEKRALAIIRLTFQKSMAIGLADGSPWEKQKALIVQRDSTLRALIRSRSDREVFDKHTAAERALWP